MALPIKKTIKQAPKAEQVSGNINDLIANHKNEFTVRALWSVLGGRTDVPDGHFGIQVKKESTGESQYLLITVDNFQKHVHPPVMVVPDLGLCKEWKRG